MSRQQIGSGTHQQDEGHLVSSAGGISRRDLVFYTSTGHLAVGGISTGGEECSGGLFIMGVAGNQQLAVRPARVSISHVGVRSLFPAPVCIQDKCAAAAIYLVL